MKNDIRKNKGQSALWAGKTWTVRLAVIPALACLIKGIVDLISGGSVSEEFTHLLVAVPGGMLIGSVIDEIQKGREKEKIKLLRGG